MKLLIFSDIHNDQRALEKLMDLEADYYFAAGDLVSWSRGLPEMGRILQRRADRVYVLPGNHESEADIARLCGDFGLHTFHGRTIRVDEFHVAGLGYSSPTPFNTPGEYSEDEMEERLKTFADLSPLVLICHAPPRGTPLDRVRENLHIGSQAVRDFIERHQPQYFFCGHVHEAEGQTSSLGSTRAVNVGKRGFLLDLRSRHEVA
jgi:Icc-related predicted phosphoesterase